VRWYQQPQGRKEESPQATPGPTVNQAKVRAEPGCQDAEASFSASQKIHRFNASDRFTVFKNRGTMRREDHEIFAGTIK
jgi:hypothetical protein